MNEKSKTNEEQTADLKFAIDDTDIAVEQRQHHLFPMMQALANVDNMLDTYGDLDFQRALDYNSHIPVSDGLRDELKKHIGAFHEQIRGLLLMLRGSHTAAICMGDGEPGHTPHIFFDLSALGEAFLDELEEEDPDMRDEAMSDPLFFDWPWLGMVDREDELAEKAEEAALDNKDVVATLVGLVPVIKSEQTQEQIAALRDEKHKIHVVVPVPISRMDENNEFLSLEDFVEDAIGGETLILTEVKMRPIGLHENTHVLYEVIGVADFTHEISSFGETGRSVDKPSHPD